MHTTIRVRPNSSRTRVGGAYGDPPALVVAVGAPAVDGRANKAVIEALAEALGIPRRHISIISGTHSRTKVVDVPDDARLRWNELIESS